MDGFSYELSNYAQENGYFRKAKGKGKRKVQMEWEMGY